jgi:hypothetical protein
MRTASSFFLGLVIAATGRAAEPTGIPADLSAYHRECGVAVRQDGAKLRFAWPQAENERGALVLNLSVKAPLIEELRIAKTVDGPSIPILRAVDPEFFLTVGIRDLKQGWNVFFDSPFKRPHETFRATLEKKKVRVESQAGRCTAIVDGLSAGPFRGDLRFTVYAGCRLVRMEAVVSTEQDACAIIYDVGLTSAEPDWKTLAWHDPDNNLQRVPAQEAKEAVPVAVRQRTIVAESANGAVAMFPPPHQYLYPLDFADNYKLAWHGRGMHRSATEWGFGIRQPPEGDKRFVPWINAPPQSQQRLGAFLLLSAGDAPKALEEVSRFTHDDRFKSLPGYRTFSSHYHIEHTLNFLRQQKQQQTDGVPKGLEEPAFVKAFKAHGVDIVHLAEFHTEHTPDFVKQRLTHLSTLHRECRRLSNDGFLLLPGEEPNVYLGGHWISLFPRPVYWQLHPEPNAPFERKVDGFGTVYAVHDANDVLKLMEKEQGLMWTAHARIKSSYGFPDRYRDTKFFQSDRFLGAAWKAMPADLSRPRLGVRVLDLMDDMANWGHPKYVLGEVDVFKVFPGQELYGHMNVNYLKLDKLPRFDDGWSAILEALRDGHFFVSTGEVLLREFKLAGKESGATLEATGDVDLEATAEVEWTFPPSFVELIWGDGRSVFRKRVDVEAKAFSVSNLRIPVKLKGATWARLEAWDVAANGAFSQPVWIKSAR